MIEDSIPFQELQSPVNIDLELNNDSTCMICFESLVTPMTDTSDTTDTIELWVCPQCTKEFHKPCIRKWIESRPRKNFICPHCKYIVKKYDPNHLTNNIQRMPHHPVIEHYIYGDIQNYIYSFICILLIIIIGVLIWYIMKRTIIGHYPYHYNHTI